MKHFAEPLAIEENTFESALGSGCRFYSCAVTSKTALEFLGSDLEEFRGGRQQVELPIYVLPGFMPVLIRPWKFRPCIPLAFSSGVTDYIVNARTEDIPLAIRAVHGDRSSIYFVAAFMLQEFMRMKQGKLRASLTMAEIEILGLVGKSCTQSEIARRLHITESTAKKHAIKAIKKYGTLTSKEAASKARMKGVL